jgi:3-deoxy-manno-octulosonate cytidylyltransferase (CMP-KDO synthetase)|tara:strand:+ start:42238 stop:43017 length:780 start_codon:yes stop_codon:yes gene_type:complete
VNQGKKMIKNKETMIIIPARMAATRLPGKPLMVIDNKPMIVHIWEKAIKSIADKVIVATDSDDIIKEIVGRGGQAIKTRTDHKTGSDRIYEALLKTELEGSYSYIMNLQGDIPTIDPNIINLAIEKIKKTDADIITFGKKITNKKDIEDSNVVKVATNLTTLGSESPALYFSRSPIPFGKGSYYEHIGLYMYKRHALEKFILSSQTALEERENLEQIRALENNLKINIILIKDNIIGVDTIEDFKKAKELIENQSKDKK